MEIINQSIFVHKDKEYKMLVEKNEKGYKAQGVYNAEEKSNSYLVEFVVGLQYEHTMEESIIGKLIKLVEDICLYK